MVEPIEIVEAQPEEFQIDFSTELQYKLSVLTAKQRYAVLAIVAADVAGLPLSRLLKTSYSCKKCGWVAGNSRWSNRQRKERLVDHSVTCERATDSDWPFICTSTNYYSRWMRDAIFIASLRQARSELVIQALIEAASILQLGSAKAARELVKQVTEGEKDIDKYRAAVAVLDRAHRLTAAKSGEDLEKMEDWLQSLRGGEDILLEEGG